MNDIVYILRNDIDEIDSDELRYSLRSVVKNFSFNSVWFYGGCPKWAKPDHYVKFKQQGTNKWLKSCSTLKAIFENDEITAEFYLFNDDFYILKPYEQDVAIVNGTIYERAEVLKQKRGATKYYRKQISEAAWLNNHCLPTMNYATHTPLLVNRVKALEVVNMAPSRCLFRNLYGNICEVPYTIHDDVKILLDDMEGVPDEDAFLCSSGDANFKKGAVGVYIRNMFPEPCRYEKEG